MKELISWIIRRVPRKYLQRVSSLGLHVLGWFYAGSRVVCPICGRRCRIFLPYGRINPRRNALCPSCQSLERHRLVWLYLQEKTDFFRRPQQVLHVAPESCFIRPFGRQHGSGYVTADIESPLAKVKTDIHYMPFADNTFDVVLCNHVLEHVHDDRQALREIHRVLKPGGFAILQVPFFHPVPEATLEDAAITDPRAREKIFGQHDHVRKYGRDYTQRIAQSNLQPQPVPFADQFAETERLRFGLARGEVIYRADKPG